MPVAAAPLLHVLEALDYRVEVYDSAWRCTYANAGASRAIGRPVEDLIGRSLGELYGDDAGGEFCHALRDAAASGRPLHTDRFDPASDRWFETSMFPIDDGVMVLSRDITEERRQAAASLDRDEMLRLAQQAGGVATFEWDFVRQIARCSPEFFRLFGLPPDHGPITAARWAEFVHPDDRQRMAEHIARALARAEPAATDYRIVRADGSVRWLSYTGEVLSTRDGERMLGTVLDITYRKRVEDALRVSEERLQMALDSADMVAWDWDMNTGRTSVSPSARTVLGLTDDIPLDDAAQALVHVPPEDRDAYRAHAQAAAMGAGTWRTQFRFVRPVDGRTIWLEDRGRVSRGPDGRPVSASGVMINVTARVEAEERAARHADEIEHVLESLGKAKEAAETANRLKDQFLATLSHELRTPLNAILGYARMLQTPAIAPEKRPRAIEVIQRNAVALTQLVEDLLDMSRITTGKLRLEPEPMPVIGILREALDGVKPAADARNISLVANLDANAGTVRADSTRLQQVFWNLLANAVKFTSEGGRVQATLRGDGAHVEVTIADTGHGIEPGFLPFVFEPFRQAEGRFDRAQGGLGLGLAISRQLVELHGGTIAATSPGTGLGATFTVRLPRTTDRETPPARP